MATFTALFDASVLYPAPLRNLLLRLARTDLFRARWSNLIHEEWIGNLLANRPDLTREQLERTRSLMDQAVPDCLVRGFEKRVDGLRLPDRNDRHVLAAAIVARADVVVTYNLRDFPEDELSIYGTEAQHPDQFIRHLLDLDGARAMEAVRQHRASLKNPPKTVEEYLETLEQQRLPQSAAKLREFSALI